jgi:hypothetical protein
MVCLMLSMWKVL